MYIRIVKVKGRCYITFLVQRYHIQLLTSKNVTAFTTICRIHIKENNANKNIIKKLKYRESNIPFLHKLVNDIVLLGTESICARSGSDVNYDKRDNENSN